MPWMRCRCHQGGGHDGAGVAGGDVGGGDAALHEIHRDVDRGVLLGAHGLGGLVVHGDGFAGVDDLVARGCLAELAELGFDDRLVADEGDLDAGLLLGEDGAGDDRGGGEVAAHGVECDQQRVPPAPANALARAE